MRFLGVRPEKREVEVVEARDTTEALPRIGLTPGEVDHGTVVHWSKVRDRIGLSIVAYEFGLLMEHPRTKQPIEQRAMFGLGRQLYAGDSLLYAFDETGETVGMTDSLEQTVRQNVIWLPTVEEAERAISSGLVERPYLGINQEVLSSWPNMKL